MTAEADSLRPKLARWDFPQRELQLRAAAPEIPTLKMANLARRLLAGTAEELNQRLPKGAFDVTDMSPLDARRNAVIGLGFVTVRSCGAAVSLIESGYEPEAQMPIRTVVECFIRAQQAAADHSGEAARGILQGRAPSGLKQVANRFGLKEEVEFLDHFAHADLRTLEALVINGKPGVADDGYLEIRPIRGHLRPATQLLMLARDATTMAVQICEVFGVGLWIPSYLSERLSYYRDNPLPAPL